MSQAAVSGKTNGGSRAPAPEYAIETHAELPADLKQPSRRGSRKASYPFEQLAVNQSFFVAQNEDEKTPTETMKRLQSSISAARARLNFDHTNLVDKEVKIRGGDGKTEIRKVPVELPVEKQRDFRARAETDKSGRKGIRIYRIK